MKKMSLCFVCDTLYDTNNKKEVEIHKHPEPQSGQYRDDWIQSGLPYSKWIIERESGIEWNKRNSG